MLARWATRSALALPPMEEYVIYDDGIEVPKAAIS